MTQVRMTGGGQTRTQRPKLFSHSQCFLFALISDNFQLAFLDFGTSTFLVKNIPKFQDRVSKTSKTGVGKSVGRFFSRRAKRAQTAKAVRNNIEIKCKAPLWNIIESQNLDAWTIERRFENWVE